MKTSLGTVGFTLASFFFTASAMAMPMQQHVAKVASHLVGVMVRSGPGENDSNTAKVRMVTCQVSVPQSDQTFLYQEQALAKQLEQPYRQRFLRLSATDAQQAVESRSYKPKNPETWIGLCDQPQAERIVQMSDLGEGLCSVFLTPIEQGYLGLTQPGGCPADVRGATRITNTILLHDQGMKTWDRGYDDKWNLVWGAKTEPYEFRWENQNKPMPN